jgi:hypothetical protein
LLGKFSTSSVVDAKSDLLKIFAGYEH